MSFEDGMRKATRNHDNAAEAAPASEVADGNDFGIKDETADKRSRDESDTHGAESQSDEPGRSEESEN